MFVVKLGDQTCYTESICILPLLKGAPCHLLYYLSSAAVYMKRHNFLHNKKWITTNQKKASPAVAKK